MAVYPALQLFEGFVDASTKRPADIDVLAEHDSEALGLRVPTPVSCFKSMNRALEWDEFRRGWRKPFAEPEYPNVPSQSDPEFLEYLAEQLQEETTLFPVETLKRLEAGFRTINLSTVETSGAFRMLLIAPRFQEGVLAYVSKAQCLVSPLASLIATDSTPACLDKVVTEELRNKVEFLRNQPILWMQFGSRKKMLVFQTAQKYAILVFRTVEDRDYLQLLNTLVLETAYLTKLKKYRAKFGTRPTPPQAQWI